MAETIDEAQSAILRGSMTGVNKLSENRGVVYLHF